MIYQAKDILIFRNPTYQTVQVDEQTHLLDFVFAHMNHSCNPSTFIDCGNLTIFAERNIEPGEELTFFYPSTEWKMEKPFKCKCGASDCLDNSLLSDWVKTLIFRKLKGRGFVEIS
jgi:hypothetical protein